MSNLGGTEATVVRGEVADGAQGDVAGAPQAVVPSADGWRSRQARSQLRKGGRFAKQPGRPGAPERNLYAAKSHGSAILRRGAVVVRDSFPELWPGYCQTRRALLTYMGGDGLMEQSEADRAALVFVARLAATLDWTNAMQAKDPAAARQAREDVVRILRIEGEAMARVRELAKGRGGKPETLRERMDREQEAMDREIAASRPGAAQSVGRPS